jgi:hypothetical protein
LSHGVTRHPARHQGNRADFGHGTAFTPRQRQREGARSGVAGLDPRALDHGDDGLFGRHAAIDGARLHIFEQVIGKQDLEPGLARKFGHGGGQRLARDMEVHIGRRGQGRRRHHARHQRAG